MRGAARRTYAGPRVGFVRNDVPRAERVGDENADEKRAYGAERKTYSGNREYRGNARNFDRNGGYEKRPYGGNPSERAAGENRAYGANARNFDRDSGYEKRPYGGNSSERSAGENRAYGANARNSATADTRSDLTAAIRSNVRLARARANSIATAGMKNARTAKSTMQIAVRTTLNSRPKSVPMAAKNTIPATRNAAARRKDAMKRLRRARRSPRKRSRRSRLIPSRSSAAAIPFAKRCARADRSKSCWRRASCPARRARS